MCKNKKHGMIVGILLLLTVIVICSWQYGQRGLFRLLHAGEPDCVEVVIDAEPCEPWYMPGYMTYAVYRPPAKMRPRDPYTMSLWLLNSYCSTYYNDGTEGGQEETVIRPMLMGEEERQWIRRLSMLMMSELADAASAQPKCCDSPVHVAGVFLGAHLLQNSKIWDAEMLNAPKLRNQVSVEDFIGQARRVSCMGAEELLKNHDPKVPLEPMLEPVLYRTLQYAMTAPRSVNSAFFQGLDGVICGLAARCFLWNEYLAEPIYSERVADLLFRYMKGSSDSRLLQAFWAMENGPVDNWAQYRSLRERLFLSLYGLPIRLPLRSDQADIGALVQAWQQRLGQVDGGGVPRDCLAEPAGAVSAQQSRKDDESVCPEVPVTCFRVSSSFIETVIQAKRGNDVIFYPHVETSHQLLTVDATVEQKEAPYASACKVTCLPSVG